jgi:hypothetical protein
MARDTDAPNWRSDVLLRRTAGNELKGTHPFIFDGVGNHLEYEGVRPLQFPSVAQHSGTLTARPPWEVSL